MLLCCLDSWVVVDAVESVLNQFRVNNRLSKKQKKRTKTTNNVRTIINLTASAEPQWCGRMVVVVNTKMRMVSCFIQESSLAIRVFLFLSIMPSPKIATGAFVWWYVTSREAERRETDLAPCCCCCCSCRLVPQIHHCHPSPKQNC